MFDGDRSCRKWREKRLAPDLDGIGTSAWSGPKAVKCGHDRTLGFVSLSQSRYMRFPRGPRMRFSNSFLDEIRDRVPISSVVGPRVSWDRRKTNAPRGDYWACCPFHGEKSAVLPLRGQEGPLPLLRLRRVGRSFPLPHRTRRHELSRGGRAHRRDGRRADAGARPGSREARPAARQPARRHGAGDEVLRGAAAVGAPAPRRAPICATAGCRRRRSSRSGSAMRRTAATR